MIQVKRRVWHSLDQQHLVNEAINFLALSKNAHLGLTQKIIADHELSKKKCSTFMFSNDKIKNRIAINSKGIRRATRPSFFLKSYLLGIFHTSSEAMSVVNVGKLILTS